MTRVVDSDARSVIPCRFAFVMDQQVGLRTQFLNYERVAAADPDVSNHFVPVSYAADAGLWSHFPGLPQSIRGTMSGVQEIRCGLEAAFPLDASLWATWAAKSVPAHVLDKAGPLFLVMDMTPVQMEQMGNHYGYTRERARFMGGWKKRATARLYARTTHFFPWSHYAARSLRDDYGIPTEKITVVSPGVDTDLYCPAEDAWQGDKPVRILFVGGDWNRKGGDLLLRWLSENRDENVVLSVVTRDDVPETPQVTVHRNVANNSAELVRLYQQSDVFVLPTRADCYSLVAMEAMACGLPVVISEIGGIGDIVAPGKTGFLVPPEDYSSLAAALDRLCHESLLRQKMKVAARQRAVAHFDCRTNIGRVLAAMKAAAGRAGSVA